MVCDNNTAAGVDLAEMHRKLFHSELTRTPRWFEQASGYDRFEMPVPGNSIADLERNLAELERRSR